MEIVKKHLVWVVLGVVMLALLAVQMLVVGGRRAQAMASHDEVAGKLDEFGQFARMAQGKFPTKGDLESSHEHLLKIRAEGLEVSRRWYAHTAGLNLFISPEGKVLSPSDNEPVRYDLFAEFMNIQYLQSFAAVETQLADKMRPCWEEMLADGYYARDPKMKSREEAREMARKDAADMARAYAQIFSPKDLIPVDEDEEFPESDPGKMWRTWRAYLITRDIVQRVVADLIVEMPREVAVQERSSEEEDLTTKKLMREMKPQQAKAWRFVEGLQQLAVLGPELGNRELPDPNAKVEGSGAALDPGEDARFHDMYTVRIGLTAHIKVVEEFMRRILRSEDIFYVPVSASVQALPDQTTMGTYQLQIPEMIGTPGGNGYRNRPANPVFPIAGFEHEPPVQAELVYRVYRFRFTNTSNEKPRETAETAGFNN